jgi:serine/threonine-protein kinase RsbW
MENPLTQQYPRPPLAPPCAAASPISARPFPEPPPEAKKVQLTVTIGTRSADPPVLTDSARLKGRGRSIRRVFGGTPEAVAAARAFTRDALGTVPALDDVVLLVSELCSNAIRHTASGHDGTFEVTISVGRGGVQISVRDEGSDQQPVVRPTEPCADGGRGLQLVRQLADRWGYRGDRGGRVVFFAVHWLVSRHLCCANNCAWPVPGEDAWLVLPGLDRLSGHGRYLDDCTSGSARHPRRTDGGDHW